MDFITLAVEQSRILRALDEMLGDDTDNVGASSVASVHLADNTAQAPLDVSSGMDSIAARPLFSKNAEAELYLLATNFLLYVALVIVVILVCRIYFPEALVSRSHQSRPRSYNYRVAEEQEADEEEDVSDGEDVRLNAATADGNERNDRSASDFLDFEQESLSRKQVLQRLAFCCCMLNLTFVMWGALQVRASETRWRLDTLASVLVLGY
jgi:hypothetical protein